MKVTWVDLTWVVRRGKLDYLERRGRGVQFDPTRIAARVVTGVGFLGAGAIIRQGIDMRGLTTASLWTAALYLLRGVRVYVVSRFRTTFAALPSVRRVEITGVQEVVTPTTRPALKDPG